MNVFILCTGRCGSSTLIAACQHIENYSAAHESRADRIGCKRIAYPEGHIEADNRLSWFLGRLDAAYGDDAFYVHLRRDRQATAVSYSKRWKRGIIRAYREGILTGRGYSDRKELCRDYYDTVTSNIDLFLKDKPRKMTMRLETIGADFRTFWDAIGASGNLDAALDELAIKHNATRAKRKGPFGGFDRKLGRWINKNFS